MFVGTRNGSPCDFETPFPHVEFGCGAMIDVREVEELIAEFPSHLMPDADRRPRGTDKRYVAQHLVVFDRGRSLVGLERLAPAWLDVVRHLSSVEYVRWISSVLDIESTSPARVEVRLTAYPLGGWMSRHTDRPDKSFSQVIYLCPDWQPSWGGGLALYEGAESDSPSRVVYPSAGNSVAFARSERSWHEVLGVTPEARTPRRALLIHGYNE